MKTIKIKELKIEIETNIHHNGQTYAKCEKDCPKEWQIATYEILQKLRNNKKYIDKLNLRYTWEFVQNPDNISKSNKYVARFVAYSVWAVLSCDWNPDYSYSWLGVRYFKKLEVKNET